MCDMYILQCDIMYNIQNITFLNVLQFAVISDSALHFPNIYNVN